MPPSEYLNIEITQYKNLLAAEVAFLPPKGGVLSLYPVSDLLPALGGLWDPGFWS
jgi:hypothetical protein